MEQQELVARLRAQGHQVEPHDNPHGPITVDGEVLTIAEVRAVTAGRVTVRELTDRKRLTQSRGRRSASS